MRRLVRAVLLLAMSMPSVAWAEELCDRDLHPLLRIVATQTFVYRSIHLPPPPALVNEDYIIGVGGTVVGQTVRGELCDLCATTKTVVTGIANAQQKETLRQALADNTVGLQGSCFAENDLEGPGGVRILGTWELAWYGRYPRTNRFTIVFGDPGGGGALPPCGDRAGNLLNAIGAYVRSIVPRSDQGSCQVVDDPRAPTSPAS